MSAKKRDCETSQWSVPDKRRRGYKWVLVGYLKEFENFADLQVKIYRVAGEIM